MSVLMLSSAAPQHCYRLEHVHVAAGCMHLFMWHRDQKFVQPLSHCLAAGGSDMNTIPFS